MKPKQVYNQLSNSNCITLYTNQFIALAKNVFKFENMPKSVNMRYVNDKLIKLGRVAFFYDEVLEEFYMLPFRNAGQLDLYNEPININVFGQNGYNRFLKKGEYVIMYDNTTYLPIITDIIQYAQRIALCQRTIDININQQKTPRLWQVPQEKLKSLKQVMNEIDSFDEAIATYDNLSVDEITNILSPAPFVSDKLQEEKEKIYNEFLRFIGIASLNVQKKERVISSEVSSSQGGTIAFRFNRFDPRQKALEKINEKYGLNISVSYYDGEPTDKINEIENLLLDSNSNNEESEV